MKLSFVPLSEIKRIKNTVQNPFTLVRLLANVFRLNTLSMIEEAGSGHIGSSFSCMDILTWIWSQELRGEDVYFSSKGHDVPAIYSALIGFEKLNYDLIHRLRRFPGLPGHPDIHTPGIVTNTGSLGMGISKAAGMAMANRLDGQTGHIYVLFGDGELQEGHGWESLQPVANAKLSEITMIVDHNKFQSDTWVKNTSDLGDLEKKFSAFGWEVRRCDGHNLEELQKVFADFKKITDRPQVLIADTIKGKGASMLESTQPLFNDEFYKFHSGAVEYQIYLDALEELRQKIDNELEKNSLSSIVLEQTEKESAPALISPQRLVAAYGDELVKLMGENKQLVVLDADLQKDCGLEGVKQNFPERFVECGIAEQHMVSTAGGLALKGKIPVVHSFACFLSTRPNEQIYNNATEDTKIVYVGSLAGLIPGAPGHSHQSVRDISALGAIPHLTMIEPCNEAETRLALRYAVEENLKSTYIRLVSVPLELDYVLPSDYVLIKGQGVKLREGIKLACIAYGPVMLSQVFKAAALLQKQNIELAIFNLPWLNYIDAVWLKDALNDYETIFTIDDHYLIHGQGQLIKSELYGSQKNIISLGIDKVPESGQLAEVLTYHKLDAFSIANLIIQQL